jgi:hypothetical protein
MSKRSVADIGQRGVALDGALDHDPEVLRVAQHCVVVLGHERVHVDLRRCDARIYTRLGTRSGEQIQLVEGPRPWQINPALTCGEDDVLLPD